MKKHLILTSLAAIIATTGVAGAETTTDATFDGYYDNHSKQITISDLAAYTVNYNGTAADGSAAPQTMTTTGAETESIDLAKFAFTAADGTTTLADGTTPLTLASDTTVYKETDYTANTVAGTTGYEHVAVADEYKLDAATSVEYGSYKYENPQYDANVEGSEQYITLAQGGSARTLTESYATNATYTSGSTTINSTTGAEDLISLYSYQTKDADGNPTSHKYVLSEDGTGVRDIDNDGQAVDLNNPAIQPALKAVLQGMIDAYASDSGTYLTNATNALADLQAQENANYQQALDAYNADVTEQDNLVTRYGTYKAATDAKTAAETVLSTKQSEYNTDNGTLAAARGVYNAPILDTIDDAIDTSVASGSVKTALDGKADVDSVYTKTEANDLFLTEHQDISGKADVATVNDALALKANTEDVELALNNKADKATTLSGYGIEDAYTMGQVDDLIEGANTYTDTVAAGLRGEFASNNALTLSKANAYTDSKVNKLEKDMSGGVAAATALSAVSVSGVNKGEVSVGGGYGYYNGQSAMAFGAAMGLSDRWSINAGAGLASGDSTQFSIRAGTNYKFKLF